MGPSDVTLMLRQAAAGDERASDQLLPLVYDELRALAASRLRGRGPGHTLQPTALVHEAFVRLVGDADPGWDGRGHFFAAAARAMRNILVDHARKNAALRRGGDRRRVPLEGDMVAIDDRSEDILSVDAALRKLEAEDERKARIVVLRHFGGLTNEQIAAAMGISLSTVEREWRFTKAWLQRELSEYGPGGSDAGGAGT